MRNRAKVITVTLSLGIILLVATVVSFRKDLMVQFHLYRLQREPARLLQHLEKPEGNAEREAARRFLRTTDGRMAFLGREFLPYFRYPDLRTVERGVLGLSSAHGPESEYEALWHHTLLSSGERDCDQGWMELFHPPAEVGRAMEEIAGEPLTLSEYPSLTFTVLPFEEALEIYKRGLPVPAGTGRLGCLPDQARGHPYACVITRGDPADAVSQSKSAP